MSWYNSTYNCDEDEIASWAFYSVSKDGTQTVRNSFGRAVTAQCLTEHDAVTNDFFVNKIQSGEWEVKTVLGEWNQPVSINMYDTEKQEIAIVGNRFSNSKARCSGKEYVLTVNTP